MRAIREADPNRPYPPQVTVLGPIAVTGPAGPATLVGSRQRTLVGLLALQAGTTIARDRIIDALWGDDPPRTAVKTLYSHVVRVRQAFEECGLPGVLTTRDPGYALGCPARRSTAVSSTTCTRGPGRRWLPATWPARPRRGGPPWSCGAVTPSPTGIRPVGARLRWPGSPRPGWPRPSSCGRSSWTAVSTPSRSASWSDCWPGTRCANAWLELLMLALYRDGRAAAALAVFQRLRGALADELGVDPGPRVRELHTAVLRDDPALVPTAKPLAPPDMGPVPAQLPARVGHFTGRAPLLAELDRLLDPDGARIAVIAGPAGMGKTALAVQWGHSVRARFAGGQLFLDLGGHDPTGGLAPGDALTHLLLGLGVPVNRMPAALADRANLYRTLLAGRDLLVVLDNAAGTDQVLPLVPGDERTLLVVTSRHRLDGLAVRHAVAALRLDALTADEALALLRRVVGADPVDADPTAATAVTVACGGMPLALRIAAARLAPGSPSTLDKLATELSHQDRLEALAVAGDSPSVRTVFATAYRALSRPAATLFRRLGLHPGPSFAVPLAAALTDHSATVVDELAGAHLLVERGHGRYALHDLIRLYAIERCRLDDSEADRAATVARLLDWYVAVAAAANRTLSPRRNRITPRPAPVTVPFGDEPEQVLAVLDGERDSLVAVVRLAAESGADEVAWQLTYLLAGFYEFRGHWSDRVEMCRWGLAAAQRGADAFVQGLMHSSLGVACCEVRRFDEAIEQLDHALVLSRTSGDRRGEGTAHNNTAVALTGLGRLPEAAEAFRRALDVHTGNDDAIGMALALNNIGDIEGRMGNTGTSLECMDRALAIVTRVGNDRVEAIIRDNVGQALLRGGDPDHALPHFQQALEIRGRIGTAGTPPTRSTTSAPPSSAPATWPRRC